LADFFEPYVEPYALRAFDFALFELALRDLAGRPT